MRCVAAIYFVHGGKLLWWLPYAMPIIAIAYYMLFHQCFAYLCFVPLQGGTYYNLLLLSFYYFAGDN